MIQVRVGPQLVDGVPPLTRGPSTSGGLVFKIAGQFVAAIVRSECVLVDPEFEHQEWGELSLHLTFP